MSPVPAVAPARAGTGEPRMKLLTVSLLNPDYGARHTWAALLKHEAQGNT
jgi:hypothetical protein